MTDADLTPLQRRILAEVRANRSAVYGSLRASAIQGLVDADLVNAVTEKCARHSSHYEVSPEMVIQITVTPR